MKIDHAKDENFCLMLSSEAVIDGKKFKNTTVIFTAKNNQFLTTKRRNEKRSSKTSECERKKHW